MRIKLFVLCFSLTASVCFGQQHINQHIKFNDLELNGTLSSFVLQLEKKGYSLKSKDDIGAVLEGTFIEANSIVDVYASPKTKTVYTVIVTVASYEGEDFPFAKATYQSIKELLAKKYGKPKASLEYFSEPYHEGDGNEMKALQDCKCIFSTLYQIKTGQILLRIGSLHINNTLEVIISYIDDINSEINSKEEEEFL